MNVKRGYGSSGTYRFSKRGQVTIFIIVGIVIVFTFAAILYFTKSTVTQAVSDQTEPLLAEVPQAFQPIKIYTENCLEHVGKVGLLLLGQQGGYIYPDLVGKYSSAEPTNSEGINLEPLHIPYWHYNTDPNEGNSVTFASLQPKLSARDDPALSLEAQLGRYVKEQINQCLNGYQPFVQQGFTISPESISSQEATVTIGENTVAFLLRMPLQVQKGDAEASLEQFYVKIPLPLKHYYEVAAKITEAQRNYNYLERQGMELISVYSRKDRQSLPPTSDVGYELFSPLSWDEVSVEQRFTQLLVSHVPLLRYLGSENFYYSTFAEGNRVAQKVVDNMVLPLTGAEDIAVDFDYFNWKPYFNVNSDAGIIKPDHLFVNFGPLSFGTQQYETHYDASYPILVTLNDDTAFNGEGYRFVFALQSNIRNNAPAVGGTKIEPYPRSISSLACAEEQRTSDIIKTIIVDSFTKEPLETVKIGFTVPDQAECEVGVTDKDGELASAYPAVYGGVINLIHPDYLTNFYPIDTYKVQGSKEPVLVGYAAAGVKAPKVIEMDRIKTIPITVQKKEFKKCVTPLTCDHLDVLVYKDISCEKAVRQCFLNGGNTLFSGKPALEFEVDGSLSRVHQYYFIDSAKDLSDQEEAVITLERMNGFHQEVQSQDFTAVVNAKGKESVPVQLVPGVYKVSALVMNKQEIIIPKDKRCFQYTIVTRDQQDCFDMAEQKVDGYLAGSMQWETSETYLTITPEQLYSSRELTFYVPAQNLGSVPSTIKVNDETVPGRVVEDLQVSSKIAEWSKLPAARASLEPEFS